MPDRHTLVAIASPAAIALDARTAAITLDERWSPYIQGTLACRLPNEATRASLDLREGELRIEVRIRRDFGLAWSLAALSAAGGNTAAGLTSILGGGALSTLTNLFYRPFVGSLVRASQSVSLDLYVRDRVFDDVAKTLSLELASDEAKLEGDILLDSAPLDPGSTSLSAIVNSVLARHDARLGVDVVDVTVEEVAATYWQPGDSAASYLAPLLEAASLRLWCDERRVWHLTERQATVPGAVVLPDAKLTGHRDRMSLDPDSWCDAVIVIYRWTDEFDLNRVEYDFAGAVPSRAGRVVERDGVTYPGPGAAAGILARAQGRGRVLDVTAVNDYTVRPGVATTITPPETPAQTGYTSAITWRLPDAEMEVATRGLVDTPETAYTFGPSGFSYLDVDPGVAYTEFDWSMADG